MRNIFMSRKWVRADINQIQEGLKGKIHITSSNKEGYRIIRSWIVDQINLSDSYKKIMEVT